MSDTAPVGLSGKKFRDSLCFASLVIVRVVDTDSRNRPVLYIADCKDDGNVLKPYLPEKKTVVVLKTLVLERAWVPSLVHPA